jgi:hypothetical protein
MVVLASERYKSVLRNYKEMTFFASAFVLIEAFLYAFLAGLLLTNGLTKLFSI